MARLLIHTVLVLLFSALGAGCLDATPEASAPGTPAPTPVEPGLVEHGASVAPDGSISFPYSASGCTEGVLILGVEPATAQASMPEGWVPADLQGVLEAPAPTGKAGVWINAYRCAEPAQDGGDLIGAEMGIVVEAPQIANATIPDADLHIYLVSQITNSANFTAILDRVGVPSLHPELSTTTVQSPQATVAQYSMQTDNATYRFAGTAASTGSLSIAAHFWHETPTGLAYTRYELVNVPVQKGAASDCAFTGLAAELAGASDCQPGPAFVLLAPEQEWTAAFHHVPGAHLA